MPKYTPQELTEKLQKVTIGQDKYVKDLCTAVWTHCLRKELYDKHGTVIGQPKINVLVLGKSGTGKTSTVKELGKILDIPVIVEDASTFTGTGWKGREVSSIIKDILTEVGTESSKSIFSIVVLDEIDKIFGHIDVASFPPVYNFLKFIEGGVVHYEEQGTKCTLNTDNILFICLGAFDGLAEIIKKRMGLSRRIGIRMDDEQDTKQIDDDIFSYTTKDDLIAYGINPQFLGRIAMITSTRSLQVEDFEKILTNSAASPLMSFGRLLYDSMGVNLSATEDAVHQIATEIADSRTGGRALMQRLSEILQPSLFELPNRPDVNEIQLVYDETCGVHTELVQGKRGEVVIPEDLKPQSVDYERVKVAVEHTMNNCIYRAACDIIDLPTLNNVNFFTEKSQREVRAACFFLSAAISEVLHEAGVLDEPVDDYPLISQKDVLGAFDRITIVEGKFKSKKLSMVTKRYIVKSLLFNPDIDSTMQLAREYVDFNCGSCVHDMKKKKAKKKPNI